MPMEKKGLAKLVEECGELVQIAAKKMTCMDTDVHFDGQGSVKERLENEIADVLAATRFVGFKLELDMQRIMARMDDKLELYFKWDEGDA